MKICRSCRKAWMDGGSVQVGSNHYWVHFKTAQITWCGVCIRKMLNEFELQFKVLAFNIPRRKG